MRGEERGAERRMRAGPARAERGSGRGGGFVQRGAGGDACAPAAGGGWKTPRLARTHAQTRRARRGCVSRGGGARRYYGACAKRGLRGRGRSPPVVDAHAPRAALAARPQLPLR